MVKHYILLNIDSDNGLSTTWSQVIILTNVDLLLFKPREHYYVKFESKYEHFLLWKDVYENVVNKMGNIHFRPQCLNGGSHR